MEAPEPHGGLLSASQLSCSNSAIQLCEPPPPPDTLTPAYWSSQASLGPPWALEDLEKSLRQGSRESSQSLSQASGRSTSGTSTTKKQTAPYPAPRDLGLGPLGGKSKQYQALAATVELQEQQQQQEHY
ncbi:hypothetical protein VTN00DRAFT_4829 [Thermoascus crustaceus]|uniref:uncharacterized protein n=1 Tax=Thermoascus crustaceus TaxID=5088 RepID=UPI0037444B6C